jgi:hypothetical protein
MLSEFGTLHFSCNPIVVAAKACGKISGYSQARVFSVAPVMM